MHERWRIELFGGLRATYRDTVITRFRTQKTAHLLAYLAYHREQAHPREALIDLLWPEATVTTGRQNMRTALASLRRQLEPPSIPSGSVLLTPRQTSRHVVGLNSLMVTTDVADFEASVSAAFKDNSDTAVAQLEQAIGTYRNGLLTGYYEEWIQVEARRLEQLYLQSLEYLAGAWRGRGETARAVPYLERILVVDAADEKTHRALLDAFVELNELTLAQRQFEQLEALLQETNEQPSESLRQIAQAIQQRLKARPRPTVSGSRDQAVLPAEVRAVKLPPASGAAPESLSHLGLDVSVATYEPRQYSELPLGTLNFLFCAVAGAIDATADRFHNLFRALRSSVSKHHGQCIAETSATYLAAFVHTGNAAHCALECRRLWNDSFHSDSRAMTLNVALATVDVTSHQLYRDVLPAYLAELARSGGGEYIGCAEATASLLRLQSHPDFEVQPLSFKGPAEISKPDHVTAPVYCLQVVAQPREVIDNASERSTPQRGFLPLQPTRFFGREDEIDLISDLLRNIHGKVVAGLPTGRLVTLTGPGGIGKTRLSLQVAQSIAEQWAGAVWFVPLVSLSAAAVIPAALGTSLGLKPSLQRSLLDQAADFLRRQPSLLIVDNFEHLLGTAEPMIQWLLDNVPNLTIVVTSRAPLNLAAETKVVVPPLPSLAERTDEATPGPSLSIASMLENAAIQLFVDRARSARPDFQLTPGIAATVAALCTRLEGMPLAIELAAGRSLHTTPQRMLAQLEQRLDAFVNTDRNIDPRHRTLRDTIAWSIDLLDDDLQRFFAHLSVFHGGWDVEAAADVAGEPRAAEFVEALCAWSLVMPEPHQSDSIDDAIDDTGASPSFNPRRYAMLETLREYGAGWLRERGGLEAARLRHARYFERLQWDNMATLWGPQQMRWLPRLRRDEANLWAAMDWCSRHTEDPGVTTMLAGLGYCYNYFCKYTRRYELARRWTARALEAPPVDGNDYLYRRGLLLQSSAEILCRSPGKDDLRLARVHCEEAVVIYTSLVQQGGEWVRLESGELEAAAGFLGYIRKEQGDSLRTPEDVKAQEYRPAPTDAVVKHALYALAMGEHALVTGDYKTAISHYWEARKLATPEHASIVNIIHGHIQLGEAARLWGEHEIAVAALEEAIAGIEQSGLSYFMPRVRLNQGWLARAAGLPLEALNCFATSLSRAEDESLIRTDLESLLALGGLLVEMGEGEPGVTLLSAGTAGYESAGRVMYAGERGNYERDVALAHQVLEQAQFAAAWQRGLSLPVAQAIVYGLSMIKSILQSTPL